MGSCANLESLCWSERNPPCPPRTDPQIIQRYIQDTYVWGAVELTSGGYGDSERKIKRKIKCKIKTNAGSCTIYQYGQHSASSYLGGYVDGANAILHAPYLSPDCQRCVQHTYWELRN